MINKIFKIITQAIPVIMMIALISLIENDYVLSLFFIGIIIVSLLIKYEKNELTYLILGLVVMAVFEIIFVNTGVESFNREVLFLGIPIWLPILWAYAFIAIKRGIKILGS